MPNHTGTPGQGMGIAALPGERRHFRPLPRAAASPTDVAFSPHPHLRAPPFGSMLPIGNTQGAGLRSVPHDAIRTATNGRSFVAHWLKRA